MKKVTRMAAQGDVLFRRVDRLPTGARWLECKGEMIVAHSETGHHHVVETHGKPVALYAHESDPLISYLVLPRGAKKADVVHRRPFDTHETLRLLNIHDIGETVYEIRRQREWAPEGWRQVAD